MPFCPKCKVEYREGFTICSDCKVPLVASLKDKTPIENTEDKFSYYDNNGLGNDIIDVDENDVNTVENKTEFDSFGEEIIEEKKNEKANEEPSAEEIKQIELTQEERDLIATEEFRKKFVAPSKEYVSKEEKAKENLSTGIMLIIMGVLGCTFIGLLMLGVLPFKVGSTFSYVIDGVLFLFFAMFVYFGINSIVKVKKLKTEAGRESENNDKFEEWFVENITKKTIDYDIDISDDDQMNFFKRNAKIKFLVLAKFPELDENYVDTIIDKHYEDIFG
ncbi:MAG: hypothetical protein K5776_04410 [Lachnospiraceae bacterium]|nr:hypothetical protein [Lachnospiraceae bacterium]